MAHMPVMLMQPQSLDALSAEQLSEMTTRLLTELRHSQALTCGVRLQPLVDALKAEILAHRVLHADETPVQMLKPGKGTTHRAYLWAYAPGAFEDMKAVVYDFCGSMRATSWATGKGR